MSSALSDSHTAWLAGPNEKGGGNDRFIITGFASVTFIFKEKMRLACGEPFETTFDYTLSELSADFHTKKYNLMTLLEP